MPKDAAKLGRVVLVLWAWAVASLSYFSFMKHTKPFALINHSSAPAKNAGLTKKYRAPIISTADFL